MSDIHLRTPIDLNTLNLLLPTVCPHCNKGIKAQLVASGQRASNPHDDTQLIYAYAVLLCPVCHHFFYAEYTLLNNVWHQPNVYPLHTPVISLPTEIKKMFPDFYDIYVQSAIAESQNLTLICGMGYRKSLEYLAKEYAIQKEPEKIEEIQKEPLGKTVARFDNPRISSLAKASTWLGNDHTHMIQKHPEYNVADLKKFITALAHLIVFEYIADTDATDLLNS